MIGSGDYGIVAADGVSGERGSGDCVPHRADSAPGKTVIVRKNFPHGRAWCPASALRKSLHGSANSLHSLKSFG